MSMPNFNEIHAHYARNNDRIMRANRGRFGIPAYAWNGLVSMTPIEEFIWEKFRYLGIVMYPQYPVGRFFVDFGNPKAKVAIECDGRAYHQDKEKDALRQKAIVAMGWTVYRFTGRECRQPTEDFDNHGGTTYGRLKTIASIHRLSESTPLTDEACADFLEYEAPRLVKFAI